MLCAAVVAAASLFAAQGPAIGAAAAPSDYFYGLGAQWGFDRIKTLSAWQATRGGGTTVALIDTGIDVDHVDLAGQWRGIKDYVGSDGRDNEGHGTMMAGIIAARTNNKDEKGAGVGVAAIAPDSRLLPVRWVARESGGLKGSPANAAAGIRWAVQNTPDPRKLVVVLGWDWPNNSGSIPDVKEVYANADVQGAIKAASDAGAVVVVAAGNSGSSAPAYNPDLPGVIVVGATTQQDGLPSWNNGGADLLAPGHNIVSTYWGSVGSFPCPQHAAECDDSQRAYESIYGVGEGTSLAAAHVAGVVALMQAKGGLTNAGIVDKLVATGEPLGKYKLLDAAKALEASIVVPPPPSPQPTQGGGATPPVIGKDGKPTALPSPGRTTKPKPTKGPAGSPSAAPTAAGTPDTSPSATTSETTPSQRPTPGGAVSLDGSATFLAAGLNFVAGAIDATGGFIRQVGVWQTLAGLGIIVTAFEGSRWAVRRKQRTAVPAGEAESGPNDILP